MAGGLKLCNVLILRHIVTLVGEYFSVCILRQTAVDPGRGTSPGRWDENRDDSPSPGGIVEARCWKENHCCRARRGAPAKPPVPAQRADLRLEARKWARRADINRLSRNLRFSYAISAQGPPKYPTLPTPTSSGRFCLLRALPDTPSIAGIKQKAASARAITQLTGDLERCYASRSSRSPRHRPSSSPIRLTTVRNWLE